MPARGPHRSGSSRRGCRQGPDAGRLICRHPSGSWSKRARSPRPSAPMTRRVRFLPVDLGVDDAAPIGRHDRKRVLQEARGERDLPAGFEVEQRDVVVAVAGPPATASTSSPSGLGRLGDRRRWSAWATELGLSTGVEPGRRGRGDRRVGRRLVAVPQGDGHADADAEDDGRDRSRRRPGAGRRRAASGPPAVGPAVGGGAAAPSSPGPVAATAVLGGGGGGVPAPAGAPAAPRGAATAAAPIGSTGAGCRPSPGPAPPRRVRWPRAVRPGPESAGAPGEERIGSLEDGGRGLPGGRSLVGVGGSRAAAASSGAARSRSALRGLSARPAAGRRTGRGTVRLVLSDAYGSRGRRRAWGGCPARWAR